MSKLPDSFPKRLTINLTIDMETLMEASLTEWGGILSRHLYFAEQVAVEQIKDYRQRMRVFRYCGADPGEGFVTDYHTAWVTTDDGVIQFLRLDMLPVGKRTLDSEMGLFDGTYEEYEDDGMTLIRKIPDDRLTESG